MLRFICFGSGSSGNCYFLFTETDGLLIDVGVGLRRLKKHFDGYGLKMSSIKNILITHDHADHVRSVGSLSMKYQLPVYATKKVHEGIRENFCVKKKIDPSLVRIIEKGTSLKVGEFTVTSFDVPHDSKDNVGYKIEYGDVVFCLITDAGEIKPHMQEFISDANYLVIEANHDEEMLRNGPYPRTLQDRVRGKLGHLSNHECAQALIGYATPKLKHVWLCHLSDHNNHPELAKLTVESDLHDNGIVVGKDFLLDVLKRQAPSGIYELK